MSKRENVMSEQKIFFWNIMPDKMHFDRLPESPVSIYVTSLYQEMHSGPRMRKHGREI